MSYCEEFQLLIEKEDFSNFLHLWEEYCLGDRVDGEELITVLKTIKNSIFATSFGKYAETVLGLWKMIQEDAIRGETLRLTLDLQSSNSTIFAELACDHLKQKYGHLKDFNEMMRLVGLRNKKEFQGAISHFELLHHMKKGSFVFHTGGWGVGEIMDVSLLREHALIEFEGINTPKDLSFENAFKNLLPLPEDHFLSRRFGNPDGLEKEGKEDPLALIQLLLRDLGPKNAQDIKTELCELVIPESEWSKWWQQARAKIKKDTKIESPKSSKDPFILRKEGVSHDVGFRKAFENVKTTKTLITTIYNYLRDFPEVFKNSEIKKDVQEKLEDALKQDKLEIANKISLLFLLEELAPKQYEGAATSEIVALESPEQVIGNIEITSLKKRFLVAIRNARKDYYTIFSHLVFLVSQNLLRDYLFKELSSNQVLLKEKLEDLINKVTIYPEAFFWYFQRIVSEENLPLGDSKNKKLFLEAFFIVIHYIEDKEEYRDQVKKMHNFLTQKRYLIFREIIQDASKEYLQELLLLASKCQLIDRQELRTLHALAEVVQPSLKGEEKEKEKNIQEIWTTEEGYKKLQQRMHQIGTIETVDNAKEIEAARALGDLRENSEYKFALERRSRLQSELKTLSRELNHARVLTKEDIVTTEVGVGTIVEVADPKGKKTTYTLLGPWDADPAKNILSFQSKLAEAMMGKKVGDSFDFQGEKYKITLIKSYL